jgi:glycogen(starch) synthase
MPEPWQDVDRAATWLRRLADRFSPDVVHLNGYCHAALPWPGPAIVVGHSSVLAWWRAVKGEDAPPAYDEYAKRVREGLRSAATVVFPTVAAMEDTRAAHGDGFHATVIANARRHGVFLPAEKQPFVLGAGRAWDEAKNVALLDSAAAGLDCSVFIAGETAAPGGAKRAFAHAHALGALGEEALAGWLSRARVFALPARYEPFGLAALEAGLAGCALVLGDIASLREVWGDAALYVNPDDAGALQRALRSLMDDTALASSLGKRARARAVRFSVERQARAYLQLYDELVTKGACSCAS